MRLLHSLAALTLGVAVPVLLGCGTTTPPPATAAVGAPVVTDDAPAATQSSESPDPRAIAPSAAAEPAGPTAVGDLSDDDTLDSPIDDDAGSEDPASPEAVQSEALELCQSAAEFIDLGELDDAVDALDRAYQLMLALPVDDNGYLQTRRDIRRLVADLVVKTYASQGQVAAEPVTTWDLEIAMVENEHVQREIRSFTTVEREAFLAGYRRSGIYRPMILSQLETAGLPSQLSWMPLVESWFKVRALSRASALGLWQFISSTGLRYGLHRDAWIDERMDPDKATAAAIAYLTELHGLFGDWPKALAAYNCGEARVQRAQSRDPSQYLDFWDLYELLPGETRRYVPRFLAALMIIEEPAKYGMELPELLPPVADWTTVTIDRAVSLDRLESELGLDAETLRSLNPELRHQATPDRPYDLRVPAEAKPVLLAKIDELPEWSPPTPLFVTHRVRRGDTLSGIASRYGASVSAIMRSNNLRSANRIWPGQRLQVPTAGGVSAGGGTFNPASGTHTVRRGESLYSIARRYSTTVARLRAANNLSTDVIFPGQELTIRPGSREGMRRYQIRRGDTLGKVASDHRVRLSALLAVNGLSTRSTIYPGQWLAIP